MHLFHHELWTDAFKMATCIIQHNAMDNNHIIYFCAILGPSLDSSSDRSAQPHVVIREIEIFVRCFLFLI